MIRTTVFRLGLLLALAASSPVRADEILRFTAPATANGIRGQGVAHVGYAHPRSRHNFATSAVFSDPDLPGNVFMIGTTGDSTIDPITRLEIPEKDTHEVMVGRSTNGGSTFAFRRVLRWTNGLRMVRVSLVPDPTRTLVWSGLGQVYRNVPDNPGEDYLGTTRVEIDWQLKKTRLLKSSGVGWDEYPFTTVNPPEPGFLPGAERTTRFTHVAQVLVNNAVRYEAWASEPVDPQGSAQLCSATDPEYKDNTDAWAAGSGGAHQGKRIVWYHFDPVSGIDPSSRKVIGSSLRHFPTDNPRSDLLVTRGELGNEEFLYVGTQDQIVCSEIVTQNTAGSSIRFIKLRYDATTDNYTETEHGFLLNIQTPTAPNWTCPASVTCTSSTRNAYAFVGAVPYLNGATLQIYANKWGGSAPTLPIIGEVGTVQLTTSAQVITLQRSYTAPVVFLQPATAANSAAAVARVTAVGTSSFTAILQEESTQDQVHAAETFSYVVLERGTYRLSDRRVLEVDKVSTAATLPATVSWISQLDLRDSAGGPTGAIALTQLQSRNDPYFAKTRQLAAPTFEDRSHCNPLGQCGTVSNARVAFGIENDERGQRSGRQHGSETVGILAIGERWLGRRSGVFHLGPSGASGFDLRRVSVSSSVPNAAWTPVAFEAPHTGNLTNPIFLSWTESRTDPEPVGLRYRQLTSTGVELALDEDQSFDAERAHATESVLYWVIGKGNGLLRGQPISLDLDHLF